MSESHSQPLEMSSDKNLFPKSVSKNSDSFDDRICDDLSEVLLQFLALIDKLRYECVSKQFQRTTFVKKYEIISDWAVVMDDQICDEIKDKYYESYIKSFELVVKKCKNIQKLKLFLENNRIFKSILPLITKYCHNLIEFSASLYDMTNPELNEEFYLKFGSKLKYIRCGDDLNRFPNLHSTGKYSQFDPPPFLENILPLNLKNLKELNISLTEENIHLFPEVLQKFRKIRHLGLRVESNNQNAVSNGFKESAVLQNLIELKYNQRSGQNGNNFFDSLKELAKKFPKLKSIAFEWLLVNDFSDLRQQLSPLKAFPELKRLNLELLFLIPQNENEFSLKPFEELQNITHLEIWFKHFEKPLNEKILTNIDKYLPKLQYLCISPKIITQEEEVEQMADSLSNLSSLHTINLCLGYFPIPQLMRAKIAEKCRKIRNINI